MSLAFPDSDSDYSRYLFEYRHGGSQWGIEIVARSPEEAKERLKALAWARYQGEVKAKIAIPSMKAFKKIASWFR